ncbi:HlyC/CorC family transporter [Pseudomonas sp. UBA6310]|uniref:HlyC/CorC family transporter n=1 Tax=Pseudomonas sp. UBA6310 TaxID=1947327 RepID=UPI00258089C1|nr:HlyC/CorC family transporter [Pseudomonas sp. UBA6310]
MDTLDQGSLIGLLVFLALASAFFSASKSAVLGLDRQQLRELASQGSLGAKRINALLKRPQRLFGSLLLGNSLALMFGAAVAGLLGLRLRGEPGLFGAVAALLIAWLIVATLLPRSIAARHPQALAFACAGPLKIAVKLLYPPFWLLDRIAGALLRLVGIRPPPQGENLSGEESPPEEIDEVLPEQRQHLLLGILDKMTVDDIMIPRNEVEGIDLNDDIERIVAQLRSTSHTRLPVFRGDINQIEGILHMRRIARLLTRDQLTKDALRGVCHEPYFVPENTPLSVQLMNFQKHKRRIGIVVDEYGEVLGICALEDLLEEIVGQFHSSDDSQDADIQTQPDGTQVIDGAAHVRDINRALGWQLPVEGPRTLNGLITEALEGIPDSGVCLKIGRYRLEILQAAENRATRVRVWLAPRPDQG